MVLTVFPTSDTGSHTDHVCLPGAYPVYSFTYWRWWLIRGLQDSALSRFEELGEETPLMPLLYRLLGARIGAGCVIDGKITDPDLVQLGSGVVLGRESTVACHHVSRGLLVLQPVTLHEGCRIGERSYVTPGTVLLADTIVHPMSTTDELGPGPRPEEGGGEESVPLRGSFRNSCAQSCLRLCVGAPLLVILEHLAFYPVYLVVQALHAAPVGELTVLVVTAWLSTFVYTETYFLAVVLLKWTVIRFSHVGTRSTTELGKFRYWLLERLTCSQPFKHAMEPWINTELLSIKFRMLGAKIGRRVSARRSERERE